ncbi:MAG: glycine cleavage system aminomethyltransferase GcvT [Anaerolineales bacterium]
MSDFLVRGALEDIDPDLHELTQLEAERQYRRLILIPSESTSPMAVRQILASAFHNIYAEGYPDEETRGLSEEEILDLETRLAEYRRYGDPRYYKGVEYVDIVEALARRRCAEAFAANDLTAEDLYVNVQPLSGGPANNAVYHALVEPGDTVMGMDLKHGGHLSHGSPVNRSGKYYNAVHYTVDPESEKIDYDRIAALAEEHRPKMIIGGYSSYPWTVDWAKFRQIADSVGAYLLADIAHVAGLVAVGLYPSPIGYADVVSFTTHKSLCGPRGAALITADPKLATKIDRAVFPGEQGGPHINTIAAQALTFKLAQTEEFEQLQQRVLDNAQALSDAIEQEGIRIAFGGTNTHLTNVDCSSVVSEEGTPLSGDIAARVLDLAGIVCNRNTIPGDTSALRPSGVRLGTPWISQRGFDTEQSAELGRLIARTLKACQPYSYPRRRRDWLRAKIDFETLHQVAQEVRELALSAGIDFKPTEHGYPHFYYLDDPVPEGDFIQLELEGDEPDEAVRWATTIRPEAIPAGDAVAGELHGPRGTVQVTAERSETGWRLTVPAEEAGWVRAFLRDLSDGFVLIDEQDLQRKVPGPFIVSQGNGVKEAPAASQAHDGLDKPWFIGVPEDQDGKALPAFEWKEPEEGELKRTALAEIHEDAGAKMVPFAGWQMPVWYGGVLEEHLAVRKAAGLFDVSHMGVYSVDGDGAAAFLDSVVGNDVAALEVGQSHYTHFLDPTGSVIDDLMIYRLPASYLMVVNAANDDKDWAWLNGVLEGSLRVDEARPWAKAFGRDCRLRNLRDPAVGEDMRVDLALQGPKGREILLALGCADETAEQLKQLPWAGVMAGEFGGFDLIVSRTGYTGERIAYELFVHPEKSPALWDALMDAGAPLGLMPAGLGARDSLRTEAGLPLYGHEMGGEMDLDVADAGFVDYLKFHKPWFVGRSAARRRNQQRQSEVARFRFNDKGVRMAHYGDPVVDGRGRVIGKVTSCAVDKDGFLLGQAYLDRKYIAAGTPIGIFSGGYRGKDIEPDTGDRLSVPAPATVLSRFPR